MNYSAQRFADDTGVSVDLAKRILDLMDEQDLEPQDLNSVLWRMRNFVMKSKLPDLMDELTDEDIKSIIMQMVVERAMYPAPADVCCAETEEDYMDAFANADELVAMFRAARKPISEETKKKISEALKRFYYGKGGKKIKTRGGTKTTIDPNSVHEIMKSMAGMPSAVVDAAKNMPKNMKTVADVVTHLTKAAVQEVKDTPEFVKQVAQGKIKPKLSTTSRGRRGRALKSTLPESAWFFTAITSKPEEGYKEGDVVTIQIFRTGEWDHPGYGKVTIDKNVIKDVVNNFKENKRGIEIAVDENHEDNHRALGWYKEVFASDDDTECFAKIELTAKGAELLNDGAYKYFSPEIVFHKVDEESGEQISNLLIGGAFTNRPFFKGMQPLLATEGAASDQKNSAGSTISAHAYFFSNHSMHKLMLLLDQLVQKDKITAAEKSELEQRYAEVPKELRSDKMATVIGEVLAKFEEEGAPAPAAKPDVKTDGEGGEGDDGAGDGEGAADTETKPDGEVKTNEDGTFTVDATFMESVKGMQKSLSTMSQKATFGECQAKVKTMCFSEKQPTNVVLPKHVTKIAEFASKLAEPQRKVFFEIIGSLKAVPAGVKGHGDDVKQQFADAKSIPATDEKVAFFTDKMGMKLEQAQLAAFAVYSAKAAK